MTISIGLIPNKETVMLIQDSEVSISAIGFTQDIYRKIQDIDNSAVTGVIGYPTIANEIIRLIKGHQYKTADELSDKVEQAYHGIRNKHIQRGVLAKYGFSDIREVLAPQQGIQIDPRISEEVLKTVNNENNFSLDLMLATNYHTPLLNTISFPGLGRLKTNIKDYDASGSGWPMAVEKMGVELENYRWHQELSIDQGIDVLMKAGKVSEKHTGVGGPFEIVYITRKQGITNIERPNHKKINMIMYIIPFNFSENIMDESIKIMRNSNDPPEKLAEYIKSKSNVGIEFDNYFNLK